MNRLLDRFLSGVDAGLKIAVLTLTAIVAVMVLTELTGVWMPCQ